MPIVTKQVDYAAEKDAADLVRLLSEYATLEMGTRSPDLANLPQQLADFPTAFSVLAYSEADQREAIGLVNCFFGFSTFRRRRLVNIHDVIVTESQRGKGVSSVMLDAVERIANEHDCCRLTLEVLADNVPARQAYRKHGFTRAAARGDAETLFLHKTLLDD